MKTENECNATPVLRNVVNVVEQKKEKEVVDREIVFKLFLIGSKRLERQQ